MSFERWSVRLANLDPAIGSEQGRTRPVLVISSTALKDILPVVNVLPITSRKGNRRIYPNEALLIAGTAGLTVESIALCYQINESRDQINESRDERRHREEIVTIQMRISS